MGVAGEGSQEPAPGGRGAAEEVEDAGHEAGVRAAALRATRRR